MFKNSLLFALLLSLFFASCADKPKPAEAIKTEKLPEVPMVGGDSDAHGCKASAGYTWSVVKNECIRIFETGIRLEAKAKDLDKSLSAFVVFKSDEADDKAELYLPNEKTSILLDREKKDGAGKWENANYILTQWKGMYSLEDKKKVLLYQGAANFQAK